MKTLIYKITVVSLMLAILMVAPRFLLAQNKIVGELTVTKNSPEGFVSINGERSVSGRSIISTSEIITSPQSGAKVVLPMTGTVLISPNSKLVLSFLNSSISGELNYGEITIETVPNTSLNLLTSDGAVTIPNQNQANIFKIAVENKTTRVQTITGTVSFNNVVVSAGEFYPVLDKNNTKLDKSAAVDSNESKKSFNPLLIVAIAGAVAVVAIIALSASSNEGNVQTVSPVR